ncbi:hypothetical protein [Allonocardiopsis opalescens]|uniref:E3 ubiquitin ligase n=1 Tax=Allonocardiopsis opalescens TaxID=1144618 RepID=A0A2T0QFM7_9ACTN|nr:hypothetical protein [Allonocardiopsis opalescens]PRY02653.1 E3 ubiquitin ligase [Allonocardiopsis opalescens]
MRRTVILLLALGVLGAGILLQQRRTRALLRLLRRHPTLDLAAAADQARDRPGAAAEIVGRAEAAAEPATAPISGRDCLWYSLRVRPRKRVFAFGGRGYVPVPTDHPSSRSFVLSDGVRRVRVEPAGATAPLGRAALIRSESIDRAAARAPAAPDGTRPALPPITQHVLRNWPEAVEEHLAQPIVGFDYSEWTIEPGQDLFVIGALHPAPPGDDSGVAATVTAGPDGLLIATAAEPEVAGRLQREVRRSTAVGTGLVVLGCVPIAMWTMSALGVIPPP